MNHPRPGAGGAVVVGYNGKRHSRDALRWAAVEAVRRGSPLLVVYAANYPGMVLRPGVPEPEPGALEAAQEVTARGVQVALEARPGLDVAGLTEVTSPSRALIDASGHADLLVVGTRGHGQVVGTLLGSIAFAAASQAHCPVIVVGGASGARPVLPEGRILVGTDGSAPAAAAIGFAAHRAARAQAQLEIVTCTGEHAGVDSAALRESAEAIAQAAAETVRQAHPALSVSTLVEDGPAERTVVDRSADADLVVVGRRGRGAFKGMLLGSVSHAVIHGAHCPVGVVGESQGW